LRVIDPRLLQRRNRFLNYLMFLILRYSRLRGVQLVVDNWTFQAFISCASIPTTRGMSCSLTLQYQQKCELMTRCLSDSEPECVLCARQHSIIREVRRNQTRLADRHDLFLAEVHEAEDGFGVVAGAFGRGVMGRKPEAV
jgi:hypothetical protein